MTRKFARHLHDSLPVKPTNNAQANKFAVLIIAQDINVKILCLLTMHKHRSNHSMGDLWDNSYEEKKVYSWRKSEFNMQQLSE